MRCFYNNNESKRACYAPDSSELIMCLNIDSRLFNYALKPLVVTQNPNSLR